MCSPVSLDPEHGLMELRSLYEHLQARILEMIETLDEVRASADYEVFEAAEEVEREIAGLEADAREAEKEIEELVGSSPF